MKSTELLTWDNVYDLPISLDECSSYGWSKSGVMSLQFNGLKNKASRQKVVDAINGVCEFKIEGLKCDGCDFYIGEEQIFCVRGWGHLTGYGALKLPEEKALEIQNGFIGHVLKSLVPKC